jgi:hypothetical protein
MGHSTKIHSVLWPTAQSLIYRCGPQHGMTLKVEYLGEYVVIFETLLANKSRGQNGSTNGKNQMINIS